LTRTSHDYAPSFVRGSHDVLFETVLPSGERRIRRISIDGGEPAVVLDRDARAPSASPTDDRFLYLAGANGSELVPTVFDPKSRRASRVAAALPPTSYRSVRFTQDGRNAILLKNGPELIEVEIATGAVVRKLTTDAVGVSFVRGKAVFVARHWVGDIWVADDPFPAAPPGQDERAGR
jgi:hypothetical protein